ncbi:unnamed protein product [Oppiella nova]|uniref:Uncharacterized protein n=1 Tax=Oppiella nova TaxID=334625 RepID=A0A7R9LWU8_9ACAR|nr:unnamed protein product [Oppiella nova]CAG2167791.1 unnamed protein product [Oppiella nova]
MDQKAPEAQSPPNLSINFKGKVISLIYLRNKTLIPLILSQCAQEVNQCLNKFATDLEVHKKHQFSNPDNQFNDICHPSNGIYSKFVACITGAEGVCASDPNFKQYVCESRKLKMRINRFNWKPTFFHHLCLNTSHDLSQGFIRHEECISGVLNARNWKCDVNYDKPIKNMRDWRFL